VALAAARADPDETGKKAVLEIIRRFRAEENMITIE
jgi:hypothetical protein